MTTIASGFNANIEMNETRNIVKIAGLDERQSYTEARNLKYEPISSMILTYALEESK